MSEAKKLAAGVTLRIPQERVDAQWANIAARAPTVQHQQKVRAWGWLLASGVGAVCASLFWLSSLPTQREPAPQGWARSVVRSDEDPVDFSLGERSRIALAPSSEMALLPAQSDAISLELTMGSARLEVGDENGRALHVHSGPFELISKRGAVRVTRQIEETGERLRVEVEGGSVDVLRDGGAEPPVHLVAGEHWSAFAAYAKSEQVHEVALNDERAKRFEADGEERGAPAEASIGATTEKRPRARREQAAAATVLFERAHVARRAGQLREAADLYGEMVERFPRDKRAALAAFELGRIRMDVLNDPRGAVQALERSLVLDARRSFAEDALARLTLAHEALSDRSGCARARDLYLQRYPDGVHAQSVAKRCAP